MRRILLLCILALLALTACGSATHPTTIRLRPGPAVCNPPAGEGHPGVCAPKTFGTAPVTATLSGRFIPDVYEGNGCKDWAPTKGHIPGAIVKASEYRVDGCLHSSWTQLTHLGIWHAAYDFLRPGLQPNVFTPNACNIEADRYVADVNAVGGFNSGPPIADAEVPLPAGFVSCWNLRVQHDTGSPTVVDYTSPGTWSGGTPIHGLLWEANYGATPDCVWTCNRVAWQFTDGVIGPEPHCTAIGCGDVSLDTGITSLLAHPPKPAIRCFGPHAQPHAASCRTVRIRVSKRSAKRDATIRAIVRNHCTTRRAPVKHTYPKLTAWSRTVRRGGVCGVLRQREAWFETRVHADLAARG